MQRLGDARPRHDGKQPASDEQPTFGRDAELALLATALDARVLPFRVMCVHGPAGIGKTHLLGAWERMCAARGVAVVTLDADQARNGSPGCVERGLAAVAERGHAIDASADTEPSRARTAIFLDDCDDVAPIQAAVDRLPSSCIVVASTDRPLAAGRCGRCASAHGTHVLPLHSLSREAATALLQYRGLGAEDVEPVLEQTGGHPLALLVATAAQGIEVRERTARVTAAINALVREECSTPEKVAAVELAALAGTVREDVLKAQVGDDRAAAQFEFLRGLSFAVITVVGLALHDTFRRAICAELLWRNPTRYEELLGTLREHLLSRIRSTAGPRQDAAIADYVRLGTSGSAGPSMLPDFGTGPLAVTYSSGTDLDEVGAMFDRQCGEDAARVVRAWAERVPGALRVCRDTAGALHGALLVLRVEQARQHVRQTPDDDFARLLPSLDEGSVVVRAWTTRDGQAPGPAAALLLAQLVKWQLGPTALPSTYLVAARPSAFEGAFVTVGAELLAKTELHVGRRLHDVVRFDWRVVSPSACLAAFAEPSSAVVGARTERTQAPLDRAELARTVQDALRWYGNDDALATTRLLETRMVTSRSKGSASAAARVTALRELLLEAVAALASPPKRAKYKRAIERTYIVGALTQEQAAEQLDLPLSTYRRHLKVGLSLVVDFLWRRNVEAMSH